MQQLLLQVTCYVRRVTYQLSRVTRHVHHVTPCRVLASLFRKASCLSSHIPRQLSPGAIQKTSAAESSIESAPGLFV